MNLFKLFIMPIVAVSLCVLSSCGCCTGEDPAPKLRALPTFKDLPTSEAPISDPVAAPVVQDSGK